MRTTYYARGDKTENGYRISLLERDENGVFEVIEMVEGENLQIMTMELDDRLNFQDKTVLVLTNDGWEEPECLSLAECLECDALR